MIVAVDHPSCDSDPTLDHEGARRPDHLPHLAAVNLERLEIGVLNSNGKSRRIVSRGHVRASPAACAVGEEIVPQQVFIAAR